MVWSPFWIVLNIICAVIAVVYIVFRVRQFLAQQKGRKELNEKK